MSHHGHQKKAHGDQTMGTAFNTDGAAGARHSQPHPDRIRTRAYEISQIRNGGPGDAVADWLRAEQEVAAEHITKH